MQEDSKRHSHNNSEEQYESIQSEEESYSRQNIKFPQMPERLSKIYDTYRCTTQTLKNMIAKVREMEEKILQLQRNNINEKSQDNGIQILDQGQEESQFMIDYGEECQVRQKQLVDLNEIYSGLKKLNLEANIFTNKQISDVIMKFLESHREVVYAQPTSDKILILSKQIHHKKKKHIAHLHTGAPGRVKSNKSQSSNRSRSRDKNMSDDDDHLEQKVKNCYSIRLIDINNFLHTAQTSNLNEIQQNGMQQKNSKMLEMIKDTAQKQVNIMTNTKIYVPKHVQILKATYSKLSKIYIILDNKGQISLIDLEGSFKQQNYHIDHEDEVVLMNIVGDNLWLGTKEGIIRSYIVKKDQLKLVGVYGCFDKSGTEIDSYLILGQKTAEKILFSISKKIFQLNIQSYEIKEVSVVSDTIINTFSNFLLTNQQIYELIWTKGPNPSIKDKYELIRQDNINKWYYTQRKKSTDFQLMRITIFNKTVKMIVGDKKGNLKVISI